VAKTWLLSLAFATNVVTKTEDGQQYLNVTHVLSDFGALVSVQGEKSGKKLLI